MAYTPFTAPNPCPGLPLGDNVFTVNPYFAKKSAGLDIDSTSGWRSAGPISPGSYEAPLSTTTTETKLGGTKVVRSQHVTDQDQQLNFTIRGITPFGLRLKNKNTIDPTVTYIAAKDTLIATVTSRTEFDVTATEGANFAAGDLIEISMSSGNAAYLEYRRIESVTTDTIVITYPLDEDAVVGATVKGVESVKENVGGSQLQPYSGLIVCTGSQYDDQLIHYFPDLRISEANHDLTDTEASSMTFNAMVFGNCTTTPAGKKEVVFGEERLVYAEPA